MKTHLSGKEMFVLKLLAKGKKPEEISREAAGKLTKEDVHSLSLAIRKQTGISTSSPQACRDWYKRHPTGRFVPASINLDLEPTATQERVMESFSLGYGIAHIADSLGMSKSTALNHLSVGCRRAGITGSGFYSSRRDEIAAWLKKRGKGPDGIVRDPTAAQLNTMEFYSRGFAIREISKAWSEPESRIYDRIVRGCVRAGILATPEAIKDWFLSHPLHKETYGHAWGEGKLVTMQDPAFS